MADEYAAAIGGLTADQYWHTLIESGWVDETPEQRRAELESNVRAAFAANPLYAWTALAAVEIDSESLYDVGTDDLSYQAHLTTLAQASDGLFHPTNLHEQLIGENVQISFEHDGRSYAYETPFVEDTFDEGLLTVINQALADSGTAKRLLLLPTIDQILRFVFVSEPTFRRAITLHIIPPARYALEQKLASRPVSD